MEKIWTLGISFPSQEIVLLEGNLCNFEGIFINQMDIYVFSLQKLLKFVFKEITFFGHIPTKFGIFSALHMLDLLSGFESCIWS